MTPATYYEALKRYYKDKELDSIKVERMFRLNTFMNSAPKGLTYGKFCTKYWPLPYDSIEKEAVKEEEKMTKEEAQAKFLRLTSKK